MAATLTSLNKALDALEAFKVRSEWTLAQLSAHLELTRPSLYRILRNLEARGYVRQDPQTKRFRLGLRTWELATTAVNEMGLQRALRPELQALVENTGEQATLWAYDHGDAFVLERVESPHRVRSFTPLGTCEPAHLLASGRCLLAFQDEQEIARVLGQLTETELRSTFPEGASARFERLRAQGFDVSRGDRSPDLYAVAAPVRDYSGGVVAALAISGPSTRFGDSVMDAFAKDIAERARAASRQLGHQAGE